MIRLLRRKASCWGFPLSLSRLPLRTDSRHSSSSVTVDSGSRLTLVVAQSVLGGGLGSSRSMDSLDSLRESHAVCIFGTGAGATFTDKSVPVYSPDPGFLIYCIEASGGEVSNALLVSDDVSDIKMANAAGVPCIGVRNRNVSGADDRLSLSHPDLIIESLDDLSEGVTRLKDSSMY